MNKYDFKLDLTDKTSTGKIIRKIKKHSVVLEFGCATGRMTKYMSENLECEVYIVEYNREAYDIAIGYAKDGLCEDIMQYTWKEKFEKTSFDAIIFADVLEHLNDPRGVLEEAGKLLNKGGHIYVSIPNITHNDIILNAIDDQFNYTDTGILDRTHVHFWAYNNINEIARESGMYVESVEATYAETGSTEQGNPDLSKVDKLLLNTLQERKYGQVYQFIITFSNEKKATRNKLLKPYIKSHVYLDYGEGFNNKDILEFKSKLNGENRYTAHLLIEPNEKIKKIRFDPVEYQSCILESLCIKQGDKVLEVSYPYGTKALDKLWLRGADPMLYIDLVNRQETISIDAEILIEGTAYINYIENLYQLEAEETHSLLSDKEELILQNDSMKSDISNLNSRIDTMKKEFDQVSMNLNQKQKELEQLNNDLYIKQKELEQTKNDLNQSQKELEIEKELNIELNKEMSGLESTLGEKALLLNEKDMCIDELRREIGAYMILANKKDEILIDKERNINELNDRFERKVEELNSRYDKKIEYYENMKILKLRRFGGKVYRKIKKLLPGQEKKEEAI